MAANINITDIKEELFDVIVKEEVIEYMKTILSRNRWLTTGSNPL